METEDGQRLDRSAAATGLQLQLVPEGSSRSQGLSVAPLVPDEQDGGQAEASGTFVFEVRPWPSSLHLNDCHEGKYSRICMHAHLEQDVVERRAAALPYSRALLPFRCSRAKPSLRLPPLRRRPAPPTHQQVGALEASGRYSLTAEYQEARPELKKVRPCP